MSRYVRACVPGGSFFFTAALHDRRQVLLVERVDALREAFRRVRSKRAFRIDAVVVLPDHLHCIWTLPADDADYSTRWRLIKAEFSKSMAAGESVSRSRASRGERGIWQRRFREHAIRESRGSIQWTA